MSVGLGTVEPPLVESLGHTKSFGGGGGGGGGGRGSSFSAIFLSLSFRKFRAFMFSQFFV